MKMMKQENQFFEVEGGVSRETVKGWILKI